MSVPEVTAAVGALRSAVWAKNPDPEIIFAARYVMSIALREDLPDWVEALANGNAATFEDLVEVVRDDMSHGRDK